MQKIRDFAPSNRYTYDFGMCSISKGFAQVDTSQDASYFGTWANPYTFTIVNYCEGDIYTDIADDCEEFVKAINDLKGWNEENGFHFKGIDPGIGKVGDKLKQRFVDIGLSRFLH